MALVGAASVGKGVAVGSGVLVGALGAVGRGVAVGSGVLVGALGAVGRGVAVGSGVLVGALGAVGRGVAVGLGVGAIVAIGVPVWLGTGVPVELGVGVGTGVSVGSGVYVGLGVAVDCAVDVGSGVLSSMVRGRSPTTGGSAVGRVENIPAGAVRDSAGASLESLQACIARMVSEAATNFKSVPVPSSDFRKLNVLDTNDQSWNKSCSATALVFFYYSMAPAFTRSISISVWPLQRATCSIDSPLGLLA